MAGNDDAWNNLMSQLDAAGRGGVAAPTGPSASSALGGNYVSGKAPMVYWGKSSTVIHKNTSGRDSSSQEEGDKRLGIGNRAPDATMTLQGAVADWYSWSDAERAAFARRVYGLGLTGDPSDLYGQGGAFSVWQNAVQQASNFYTFANRQVTPWQAVDLMANKPGGGLQPKTQTQTSTSVNIPTVQDAHALTRGIYQSLMGRDPDENEQDRLASMITGYAQKHPSKTTTTQTTDIHGNTSSSSSTTGGVTQAGMQDMLSQQAKADPEYGAYQAASTYWNALTSALGGMGG